jgi:hypothetical protein
VQGRDGCILATIGPDCKAIPADLGVKALEIEESNCGIETAAKCKALALYSPITIPDVLEIGSTATISSSTRHCKGYDVEPCHST